MSQLHFKPRGLAEGGVDLNLHAARWQHGATLRERGVPVDTASRACASRQPWPRTGCTVCHANPALRLHHASCCTARQHSPCQTLGHTAPTPAAAAGQQRSRLGRASAGIASLPASWGQRWRIKGRLQLVVGVAWADQNVCKGLHSCLASLPLVPTRTSDVAAEKQGGPSSLGSVVALRCRLAGGASVPACCGASLAASAEAPAEAAVAAAVPRRLVRALVVAATISRASPGGSVACFDVPPALAAAERVVGIAAGWARVGSRLRSAGGISIIQKAHKN